MGKYREEYSETTNHISSAVNLANVAIYEGAKNNSAWQGMGTTVAAAWLNGNRLSVAHVGDSRVYLVRAAHIEQLTDDHSVVYEQVKRELITKEEAQTSEMKHLLTRALGSSSEVEVDVDELTLAGGDIIPWFPMMIFSLPSCQHTTLRRHAKRLSIWPTITVVKIT